MTPRQSLLKALYPLIMLQSKLFPGKRSVLMNTARARPLYSFYQMTAFANDGSVIDCKHFAGRKVMLVNTASDCGYTRQYEEFETLHRLYPEVVILGFPANDFRQQEKGDDATIAQFCRIHFGVTFPLARKTQVIKGPAQNEIFAWLSHKEKNGWCNQPPGWNFCKYLVDEQGSLLAFFDQGISPLDKRIRALLA